MRYIQFHKELNLLVGFEAVLQHAKRASEAPLV